MASGKCCWFLSLSLIRFAPMSQICWVLCHWHFCAIRQISCRIICFIYNVTYELSASSAFTILMTSTFDGPHWGLTPMWSNANEEEINLYINYLKDITGKSFTPNDFMNCSLCQLTQRIFCTWIFSSGNLTKKREYYNKKQVNVCIDCFSQKDNKYIGNRNL